MYAEIYNYGNARSCCLKKFHEQKKGCILKVTHNETKTTLNINISAEPWRTPVRNKGFVDYIYRVNIELTLQFYYTLFL